MAKQRLIESGIWLQQDLHRQGSLKQYVESHAGKKNLTESLKQYPELAEMGINVFRVPISRYDVVNLNGRYYPKALWENVVNKQKHIWEGMTGLADHPDDTKEGSFTRTACVWLDLALDEGSKQVWGDVVFVGNYGELAEKVMLVGGKVGFSTSGFGEVEEQVVNGVKMNVVISETFEIERPADIVTQPSQNVWGTFNMILSPQENAIPTGPLPDDRGDYQYESVTNNKKVLKENKMSISKLEARSFRKNINDFIKEAQEKEDPRERLEDFKEILSMFEEDSPADLRSLIEEGIKKEQVDIDKLVKAGLSLKENLGDLAVDSTTEVLKTIDKSIKKDLKESEEASISRITVLKKRISMLSEKLKHNPEVKDIAFLESRIKSNSKKLAELTSYLQYRTSVSESNENNLKKLLSVSSSKIESLNTLIKSQQKKLNEAKTFITYVKNQIETQNKKIKELTESAILKDNKIAKLTKFTEGYFINQQDFSGVSRKDSLHGIVNLKQPEVEQYWEDLVSRHGNKILPYKNDILGQKTITEAMSKYSKLLEKIEGTPSIPNALGYDDEDYTKMVLKERVESGIPSSFLGNTMPKGWV